MTDTTPTKQRWLRLALPGVVVAAAFLLFGCYTILKHPVTEGEGPEHTDVHPQEYYRQNCIDCHADYDQYPYGYFYGVYPDYYWQYPRFGYYYAYPWWWDHHWYEGNSSETTGDAAEGDSPKAERRGGLIPPYVGGAPAVSTGGTGYTLPGTGASGGKPSTGGTPGAGGNPQEKTRVKMSQGTDSTGTPTEQPKTETPKATRRGGKP